MAIEDFFHLDEVEYAQRISRYSDQDLMKQDIVKFRQIQSGAWSVGAGLGGAFVTFGATLAVSGYGGRRINVAVRKLESIHAELLSRGLQPHDPTKRDYLIPVAVGVISCGVGSGIDVGVGHLMTAPVANSIQVLVPTDSSAIHAIASQPTEVLHGFENGVETQLAVVHADLANAGVKGVGAAALAHAHHLIPLDSSGALGEYAGQAGAKAAEQSIAGQAAGILVDGTLTQSMGNRATKCSS